MEFLKGKKALILGSASTRSIAYGIAHSLHSWGAELAFSYQSDKLQTRVTNIAKEFNSQLCFLCDVGSDQDINNLFIELKRYWGKIDIIIHSIAFAPSEQLNGDFLEAINREGFKIAHDISVYSFLAIAKAALPFMHEGGSLLTLSYYGAEKVVPNYNVMGLAKASLEAGVRYLAASLGPQNIRVNAISAGPLRTLAACGIKDFKEMHSLHANSSPMRRNITLEEVGNVAAFLSSNLASGITGEIIHVDGGSHIIGTLSNKG